MTAAAMFRKLIDSADHAQAEQLYHEFRHSIPLSRAMLCLDCESIFEAEGMQKCPACGSSTAWAIGRALSRTSSARKEVTS